MTNEIIGIVSAIALTALLFGLRHLLLPSERGKERRDVPAPPPLHRGNHELNRKTVEDDAWLLWRPEPNETAPSARVCDELAERRARTQTKRDSVLR